MFNKELAKKQLQLGKKMSEMKPAGHTLVEIAKTFDIPEFQIGALDRVIDEYDKLESVKKILNKD